MLTFYRRLLDFLTPAERRRFWLLGVVILGMAFVELLGIASIMPFLAVLSDPSIIDTYPRLAQVSTFFGFTDHNSFMLLLGGITTGVVVFSQLYKAAAVYALRRFARACEVSIAMRLLSGYLRQPYAWFLNKHSSDLGTAILSEVEAFSNHVFGPSLQVLAYGTLVVFLVLFLLVLNPMIAMLGALIIAGSYALVFLGLRPLLERSSQARVQANAQRFRIANESIGGIKEVKLLGLEDTYLHRYRGPARRYARARAIAQIAGELPRFMLEAIVFGAMMLLLLLLLVTSDGRIGTILPLVGVFAFAGMRLFPAIHKLYQALTMLRSHAAIIDTLHDDFRTVVAPTQAVPPTRQEVRPLPLRQRLELVDVGYRYPAAERSALDGLRLTIEAGTTVGLVGATGAGKTTAVDVLLGLLEPQRGTLRVDDVEIGPDNRRAWQRNLGYVPQQIFLIDDSVAANIALGILADQIDMAAVERAARIANLHDFVISQLPNGYATPVGERGVRLSGGQRQRIGIARALYHEPAVLILDEATSALDNLTEQAVMEAVNNLGGAKTIVMIAHRLSTVRNCDTIFLLEQGRCVAKGNYEKLLASNEAFRNLATTAS